MTEDEVWQELIDAIGIIVPQAWIKEFQNTYVLQHRQSSTGTGSDAATTKNSKQGTLERKPAA